MKGDYNEECNRTACTTPQALWYNRSTRAWYCRDCAEKINRANEAECRRLYGVGLLCIEARPGLMTILGQTTLARLLSNPDETIELQSAAMAKMNAMPSDSRQDVPESGQLTEDEFVIVAATAVDDLRSLCEGLCDNHITFESFTCYKCPHAKSCYYAFDPYNTDGDCLASK